jgi:DNA-directed RNA polymerase subunit RPC12/RpoP
MKHEKGTAGYRVIADVGGNRYKFYCDRSGALGCTTGIIRASSPDEELRIAWETEGRQHFNRCKKCGSWVVDVMYNADVLECVDCTPWEDRTRFCSHCGARVADDALSCTSCGAKVRYGGD